MNYLDSDPYVRSDSRKPKLKQTITGEYLRIQGGSGEALFSCPFSGGLNPPALYLGEMGLLEGKVGSLALPNPQLFPFILNTEHSNFQSGRRGLREGKPFPSL